MTGHIVVGYTATKQGRDAVAFASRLAAATGAVLDIAIILPNSERSVITPPDASYDRYLHAQAQQWIAHAIDRIPAEVVAHAHVRAAESFAEVESTKSVSDIFGPLNGTISKINDELDSSPDLVNSEPYDSGWLVEISVDDASALDAQLADMLDADGYRDVIEG